MTPSYASALSIQQRKGALLSHFCKINQEQQVPFSRFFEVNELNSVFFPPRGALVPREVGDES